MRTKNALHQSEVLYRPAGGLSSPLDGKSYWLAGLRTGVVKVSPMPHALLYTLAGFALILVLARVKVPLGLAVLAWTLAVGVLFQFPPMKVPFPPSEFAGVLLDGAIQPKTVGLLIIITLLLMLSEMMRQAGLLEQIVSLVRSLLRRPVGAMAALPALIGLLPMPGGALFSAPMVEQAAGSGKPDGGKLSAINYWYRHVWEFWWPLYPGVILAVSVTGDRDPNVTWGTFVLFNLPLSVFMIGAGLLVLRGLHPDLRTAGDPPPRGAKRKLLRASAPIWSILIVWGLAQLALWSILGPAPRLPDGAPYGQLLAASGRKFGPIVLGLAGGLTVLGCIARIDRRSAARVFTSAAIYKLVLLVLSVMVFQHLLGHVEAPKRIGEELRQLNVSPTLVVALLPFIAGLVTGLAIGFVGTSFPIVMGILVELPDRQYIYPYVVLAYAFGHMGQMMSPLHLCQIVSNKYFKTSYGPVYRQIIPSALVTGALAAGYFLLLRWIIP